MRAARWILAVALLCRAGDDAQQRLAGRAFGDTPLLQDLHELCDGIGGAAARKAGVAALLLQSPRPHGLLYRHPLANANEAITVPAAMISREQAGRLGRLAAHGEVRVRLRLANKTGGAFDSRNVVAEIRGR